MAQTAQFVLVEYGAVRSAIQNFESSVASEKQVWDEFQIYVDDRQGQIAPEAVYNIFSIAELTVRVVDVLDTKDYRGNPEYDNRRRFAPELFYRSNKWGDWTR